jgi:hypothetical protein
MHPELLEPKELTLPDRNGGTKTYYLSKFPAVAGREIVSQYPIANMPKVGEYALSEAMMLKLMAFVAVETSTGAFTRLTTRDLVNNHVADWENLARLEFAMMEYNVSFFGKEKLSTFFDKLKAQIPASISQTLTALLARLSEADKQPSAS